MLNGMEKIINKVNEVVMEKVYEEATNLKTVEFDFTELFQDVICEALEEGKLINYVVGVDVVDRKLVLAIDHKRIAAEHQMTYKAYDKAMKDIENDYLKSLGVL